MEGWVAGDARLSLWFYSPSIAFACMHPFFPLFLGTTWADHCIISCSQCLPDSTNVHDNTLNPAKMWMWMDQCICGKAWDIVHFIPRPHPGSGKSGGSAHKDSGLIFPVRQWLEQVPHLPGCTKHISLFYCQGPLFTYAMCFVLQKWVLPVLHKVHIWASCSNTNFSPGGVNRVGGETPGRRLLEERGSSCWRSWATYKADNVLQLAELMEGSTGTQTHLFFILWMKSIFWITWAVWSREESNGSGNKNRVLIF